MRLLALALCWSVVGCATVRMGRKIDPEVVKTFQEGKTTRAEVAKALGEPFNRSYLDQGRQEMWMYLYTESKSAVSPATVFVPFYTEVNTQTTSQSLTLTFNGDLLGKIDWTPYGYPGAVPPVATAPAATAPAAAAPASPAAEGEPQPAAAPVAEATPTPSTSSPAAPPATGGLAVPGVAFIDGRDLQASPPLTILNVNVWDAVPRRRIVCSLRHGAEVALLESMRLEAEGRSYFRVQAGACTGWLPETFLSAKAEPTVGDLIK